MCTLLPLTNPTRLANEGSPTEQLQVSDNAVFCQICGRRTGRLVRSLQYLVLAALQITYIGPLPGLADAAVSALRNRPTPGSSLPVRAARHCHLPLRLSSIPGSSFRFEYSNATFLPSCVFLSSLGKPEGSDHILPIPS